MGRAPCCQKVGLKKGPWSEEEDLILISFIQKNGHGNWRSLPRRAGLPRCGKSCRLRWINYLRPDIKRGNFTKEEEDSIIRLHQMLGNRWSAIAAELPGRTDNEIKNVWHTHLKKRLLPTLSSLSDASNSTSDVCSDSQSTSVIDDHTDQQLSDDLSTWDLSLPEWPISDLDGSIWSEEFTVPSFQSPLDQLQQLQDEDDMDFWMNMLIGAGDIQFL